MSEITDRSLKTAYNLIAELENIGIIKEITGASRGKLYAFDDYITLFKGNNE